MHVLVTGGAGFIGKHVSAQLIAAGHTVTVLDNLSTGSTALLPSPARLVVADVASPEIAPLLRQERPDAIVHLAAQTSVPHSMRYPVPDERVNIHGMLNLLSAAAEAGVRRLVFSSSAAVYGNPEAVPLDEETPIRPLSPYGLSKATAEAYLRMLGEAYGISYSILRFANVYGPGQTPEGEAGVVAIFCDRVIRGVAPVIFGDGHQTRDFVYVEDVAEAVRLATESMRSGEALHVSSGQATSILDLWETVRQVSMEFLAPEQSAVTRKMRATHGEHRPGDIRDSVLDNARIRAALGWSPRTALRQGLIRTLRSYLHAEVGRHA